LGTAAGHHPTRGGSADQDEFHERYRAMIRRSRQPFRELPTEMGLLGCGTAMAAARSGSESSPVNVDVLLLQQALQGLLLNVLTVVVALVSVKVGSVVSAWLLRPLVLRPSGLSTPPQLDNEHLAYLSGGPTRVVEPGLAWLVQRGVLRADPSTRKLPLQIGF
jgi:hypothetical protein